MAVPTGSPTKPISPAHKHRSDTEAKKKGKPVSVSFSPKKRSKCPGVRVIGGRIYDSENGKCCHQCRQKTMDFAASCKKKKDDKTCSINFCHKCLLNRYGEKAEEVAELSDWHCPKCRGICNCSQCMKKRGQQPTGILVHTAKATGFTSVSEMLFRKAPENIGHDDIVKGQPKSAALEKDSTKKRGKENSFDGNNNTMSPEKKKLKKTKREETGEKPKISTGTTKKQQSSEPIKKEEHKSSTCMAEYVAKAADKCCNIKRTNTEFQSKRFSVDVPLPRSIELTNVAGIDLPPEDVGHALQFLEFCSTFGKVLDVKKGQPESVLRDLIHGRRGRREQNSTAVKFHIQLLSLIQEDFGNKSPLLSSTTGKHSWLQALRECVSASKVVFKDSSMDSFARTGYGYEQLDTSKKLRLMTFLCDETLNTLCMRGWIDDEHSNFLETKNKVKEKVLAAKSKEKQMKQKMLDEVAEAIIKNKGAPLSFSEHEAIVSEIKNEAAKAHAEMLEARGMLLHQKSSSYALRVEPIIMDLKGGTFWRLKSYPGESDILLQDIGNWYVDEPEERWFVFDNEHSKSVENYISSLRLQKMNRDFAAT